VSELVLCDQQDHIATLILNRPEKHNAMSPDMLMASCDYLERLEAAAETRVLVIRGQGTRAFTSGYDIGCLPERQGQEQSTQSDGQGLFARLIARACMFPAPTMY
jgi:enoyl-CoA hydratase/carnithine racemase